MKEQIEILAQLQEVETEVANIRSLLDSLPARIEKLDARLDDLQRSIEESEAALSGIRKTYRAHESDVQMNLARMEKSRERLRTVKKNTEYQLLLKEIEDAKQRNSDIEDKMLEFLDRIDAEEDAIAKKRASQEEISG